jgi:uncharacterized protein YukE
MIDTMARDNDCVDTINQQLKGFKNELKDAWARNNDLVKDYEKEIADLKATIIQRNRMVQECTKEVEQSKECHAHKIVVFELRDNEHKKTIAALTQQIAQHNVEQGVSNECAI